MAELATPGGQPELAVGGLSLHDAGLILEVSSPDIIVGQPGTGKTALLSSLMQPAGDISYLSELIPQRFCPICAYASRIVKSASVKLN